MEIEKDEITKNMIINFFFDFLGLKKIEETNNRINKRITKNKTISIFA